VPSIYKVAMILRCKDPLRLSGLGTGTGLRPMAALPASYTRCGAEKKEKRERENIRYPRHYPHP